jgi:predicted lipid-binding transport protein (Tim44 family)
MTALLSRFKAFRLLLAALTVAGGVSLAYDMAEARPGGGFSTGSRGFRTYTPPATTKTAPNQAKPMERSMAQPGKPSIATAQPQRSNMFRNLLLGGLIGGLLGSMFGFGALASVLGFLLQTALIGGLVYLAIAWWRSRQQPAAQAASNASSRMGYTPPRSSGNDPRGSSSAYSPGASPDSGQPPRSGPSAAAPAAASAPQGQDIQVKPADFDAFERLLGEIQTAYGNGDTKALEKRTTPEMLSYFLEELGANQKKGVVNRISGVKLLEGDLSEAWREPGAEYATVAMRYSITDTFVESSTGRVVGGNEKGEEVTEVWTFTRPIGKGPEAWELSAIQQA